jgi:Uri superfamily endonuclease
VCVCVCVCERERELTQSLTKTFQGIRGFIGHSECTKEGLAGGGREERIENKEHGPGFHA